MALSIWVTGTTNYRTIWKRMVSALSMSPISITIWAGLAMAFEVEGEQLR